MRRSRQRALTLIEVVLSIALMIVLVTALFAFYDVAMKVRESGKRIVDRGEYIRTMAERVAEEIRAANGFAPGLGAGISGYSHEIHLQTVVLPDRELFYPRSIKDRPLPAQADIRDVRWYLGIDTEETEEYADPEDVNAKVQGPATLGIVRREVKTFRQTGPQRGKPEEADIDLVSSELRYLRFRYFDGVDWVDIWQPPPGSMGNSLPQAIEVTVGYAPILPEDPTKLDFDQEDQRISQPEPYTPDRYSVVVRLNQADTFFGSRLMRAQRRAFGSGSGGLGGGGPDSGFGSN